MKSPHCCNKKYQRYPPPHDFLCHSFFPLSLLALKSFLILTQKELFLPHEKERRAFCSIRLFVCFRRFSGFVLFVVDAVNILAYNPYCFGLHSTITRHPCTCRNALSDDDIFFQPNKRIVLSTDRRICQYTSCFLEGSS